MGSPCCRGDPDVLKTRLSCSDPQSRASQQGPWDQKGSRALVPPGPPVHASGASAAARPLLPPLASLGKGQNTTATGFVSNHPPQDVQGPGSAWLNLPFLYPGVKLQVSPHNLRQQVSPKTLLMTPFYSFLGNPRISLLRSPHPGNSFLWNLPLLHGSTSTWTAPGQVCLARREITAFNAIVELVKDAIPIELLVATDSPCKRRRGECSGLF